MRGFSFFLTDALAGPAKTLFRTIRAKEAAKGPSPTTTPSTRLRAAKVIPNFQDPVKRYSSVVNEMNNGHPLSAMMDQAGTSESESCRDHNTLQCGSAPRFKSNLSGRLSELPVPVFRPSVMPPVITREPVKVSPKCFGSHSMSPGIPASHASSEPRGIKRRSPDDALVSDPQSEKKLLCTPSRKTTRSTCLGSNSLVLHYTKARSIPSILQVHVKRCSPDSCFSCNERPKKMTRAERADIMDVDCPAQNNAVTSSDVAITMEVEASEDYNNITAFGCFMEVGDWQVANGIPEVQMDADDDDGDKIGTDMDMDYGAVITQATDRVIHVTAFKQAVGNGWKWTR